MDGSVLHAFVDEDGRGGNPTLVVDRAEAVSDADLQDAARAFGGELTCIYRRGGAPPRLRFFVPTGEMAFCGHGTLGAAAALHIASHDDFSGVSLEVGDRILDVTVRGRGPRPVLAELTSRLGSATCLEEAGRDAAVAALGLTVAALSSLPVANSGAERPKTLVPLSSTSALDAIRTSEDRVLATCTLLGSTGLYPFVRTAAGDVEARQFPAGAGFLEDAATVTAAIGLATAARTVYAASGHWPDHIGILQGVAMGKPSRLLVRFLDGVHVAVGGRVTAS